MKPALARALEALAALFLSIVIGAVLTVLLVPLWSWFEAGTGIESIGHSGPASWCYAATSGILFGSWVMLRRWRPRGDKR
jgi:O-antigen/teichoic acid export membrane protein